MEKHEVFAKARALVGKKLSDREKIRYFKKLYKLVKKNPSVVGVEMVHNPCDGPRVDIRGGWDHHYSQLEAFVDAKKGDV